VEDGIIDAFRQMTVCAAITAYEYCLPVRADHYSALYLVEYFDHDEAKNGFLYKLAHQQTRSYHSKIFIRIHLCNRIEIVDNQQNPHNRRTKSHHQIQYHIALITLQIRLILKSPVNPGNRHHQHSPVSEAEDRLYPANSLE